MGYPALLPSACLPASVANPPTTLPPQYDNFSQSYSPSLPSAFGCAASKFGGLISPQLNQGGLIALDMPMAASTTPQSSKPALHNLGLDQHRFMVGAPLSGTLPGHEVARAVSSVGVPLVVAGGNDAGVGAMEGSAYKRSRKRPYSEANTDTQGTLFCTFPFRHSQCKDFKYTVYLISQGTCNEIKLS